MATGVTTMSTFFKALLLLGILGFVSAGITEEQMKQSGTMVRNVCQPKLKISDEVADAIREGVFPDDKTVKCYVHCIVEMMGMMKKAKVNYEGAMKQFDALLPDDYKDDYKNAFTKCKDAAGGEKNACEAAYKIIVCFHDNVSRFTFA